MTSLIGFDILIPSFQNIQCCAYNIAGIAFYYAFEQKIEPDRVVVNGTDVDSAHKDF
jgi:hypothetical protein